jgi:hypothetical protein
MRAVYPPTMLSPETGRRAPARQASELRGYAREVISCPVVLETRDGWLRLALIDLSPSGAKVRLTQPLKEGTGGRLYFLLPHWRPRAVETIVWRVDLDGVALRFTGPSTVPFPAARGVRSPASWLWTWQRPASMVAR